MERLKPRQERFCRHFVEFANATAAAKGAGYAPSSARNAGYRLLRQPRILRRIAEIQAEIAPAHCRELDVLLGKLETVYRRAIEDHQFSAAARAIELQAKLAGVTERPTGRFISSKAETARARTDTTTATDQPSASSAPETGTVAPARKSVG
jgi:phage terminase small subunit